MSHDILCIQVKWVEWQYTALTYFFPNLEPACCFMSVSQCCFLICIQISQEAGKVSGIPIYWRIFQFFVICTVKCFGVINKAEVGNFFFLEFSCFSYDPTDVGTLISDSSVFSKFTLNIWKFSFHILLKPDLENFEHYFDSVWDECNCAVVWTFFGIASLWDWNDNWPFPVLWPLLSFPHLQICWHIERSIIS